MKIYFGWTQASEMAATYVHLSGRDVDRAILQLHGIEEKDDKKEKDKMLAKTCQRCELTNAPTNTMCSRCGLPLDEAAATQMIKEDMEKQKTSALFEAMMKDTQIREALLRKLQDVGGGSAEMGDEPKGMDQGLQERN
jgi:hypothetical protein